MIAKHVPMRSLGKSNFADLANYLTDEQSKEHRLGAVKVTNCESANLKAAIEEILATQHINTRAKSDKTYHLIVSFRAGEEISDDVLKAIEERICAGLGFGEHQRVSAVHTDTDNLHIHIAINKIHPEKGTIHEPYYPHRTLSELCELCERDYGLERDNHMPNQRGAAGRAQDMERHAGVESLVGWIKRECLTEIRAATTWGQLHKVLADNGLTLREKGNGLVFESSDGTAVKGSTLSRDLSKPALEAKFGAFISSREGANKRG
ncbi:TraI/MobA(P) family conjugative relaxase, partial [Aeromonas caviae]|uniref:TraI/MobA(P) family conjugative relaxase n=1 Tax=Aeromonas caviae TaxID=648 RepID=UPI0012FC4514